MVKFRQSVARAMDDPDYLRQTQRKIYQLRDKKQHHRFLEMTKDSNNRESHPCAIAESVADENF